MSCTALINPNMIDMAWCGLTMAAGSEVLLVIVMFAVFLYGIQTFKLPYQVFVPIGILFIFIFAGAGTGQALGGLNIFSSLMWIVIAFVGAIIALTFWGMRKG